jgi:hypothetical protein
MQKILSERPKTILAVPRLSKLTRGCKPEREASEVWAERRDAVMKRISKIIVDIFFIFDMPGSISTNYTNYPQMDTNDVENLNPKLFHLCYCG